MHSATDIRQKHDPSPDPGPDAWNLCALQGLYLGGGGGGLGYKAGLSAAQMAALHVSLPQMSGCAMILNRQIQCTMMARDLSLVRCTAFILVSQARQAGARCCRRCGGRIRLQQLRDRHRHACVQSGQFGQMSVAALAEEQQAAQQQQMAHIARAQLFLGQQQQQQQQQQQGGSQQVSPLPLRAAPRTIDVGQKKPAVYCEVVEGAPDVSSARASPVEVAADHVLRPSPHNLISGVLAWACRAR